MEEAIAQIKADMMQAVREQRDHLDSYKHLEQLFEKLSAKKREILKDVSEVVPTVGAILH